MRTQRITRQRSRRRRTERVEPPATTRIASPAGGDDPEQLLARIEAVLTETAQTT